MISRLPAYLTVQFVRFQYKGKEGINAKVLKDIKFGIDFDAFDLCSPELQEKLTPMRTKFKEVEDNAALEKENKLKAGEVCYVFCYNVLLHFMSQIGLLHVFILNKF